VASEYPLGTEPRRYHFPRRNRLISALAQGVVVVEAAGRSGSLITAAWALDQGREVMALPGPADAPGSQGCHDLIRQGAHLVTGAAEVLALLDGGRERPRDLALSREETHMLDHLRRAPQPLDVILESVGLPVGPALAALARLELAGLAVQGPGRMVWRA
jgi:DNA processing protein